MVVNLRQLQYGLEPDLWNVAFFHNKVVTACQGVPACRYAVVDPPTDFGTLLNKLQSSITAYEKEQQLLGAGSFYTDRKYISNNPNTSLGRRYGYRSTTNSDRRK